MSEREDTTPGLPRVQGYAAGGGGYPPTGYGQPTPTAPVYSTAPVAVRRPDVLAGLLLVLAGIAAALSLVLPWVKVSKATGLDLVAHPDLVNDPSHFLECGVADFVLCGCLPFAKADDILNVTRRLNGGTVGLAQREAWLAKWKAALGSAPLDLAPALAPEAPQVAPGPARDAAKPADTSKPPRLPDSPAKQAFNAIAWLSGILSTLMKRK